MNNSTKQYAFIAALFVALQFVLLMDPPTMRVEWRCITMVNGVQCVMMDGIWVMHKSCVMNWVLVMQLLLQLEHFMDEVVDEFGLIMWSVLVQR